MRKFLIAAVAAVAVLAMAGIAIAENVYEVEGGTKPTGVKASPKKPVPVALTFDYTVVDSDPANRATPIKQYRIGAESLITYPEAFPNCSYVDANNPDPDVAQRKCRKARMGGGVVHAYAGPTAVPTTKLRCNLELNLYNLKPGNYGSAGRVSKKQGAFAIRVDGDPPEPPDDDTIGCPLEQHEAILAPFFKTRIGGRPAEELRFSVPDNLLHAAPGVDTAVYLTESAVLRKTAKAKVAGKKRKVGFYSSVGCKGKTGTIRVTFIDEDGNDFLATKEAKC